MNHRRRPIFDTSEMFDYDHTAWRIDLDFWDRTRANGGLREYTPNAGLLPWHGRNDRKAYDCLGVVGRWLKGTVMP